MNHLSSPTRTVAWMVWLIASIFYAYQYILRVMPNIMIDDIMQQFGISAAVFGQFSGIYYIGYALLHLPLGIMLDRYGPRKIMSLCILLNVVGLLPLLFTSHWLFPIAGRFLIGLGSSAAILGVFKIIRMSFQEKYFSRMLSFSVMIGLIGAIYGGGPVSYLREAVGYQTVVQFFAIAGVALAALTYWIVPDLKSEKQESVLSNIKTVLGNKKVIWSCIFAGMMVGPLEGFADVWGTIFLKNVYGIEGTVAASMPSLIFVGMCFGAPVLSFIAEKAGNYLYTIIGSGFVMAACFAFFMTMDLGLTAIIMSFLTIGVCCAYQILAITKASTFVPPSAVGLTTAVANMIIMVFGYAFHTIIGSTVNALGGPAAPQALTYGVAVVPIALCIGTMGFFYVLAQERKDRVLAAG